MSTLDFIEESLKIEHFNISPIELLIEDILDTNNGNFNPEDLKTNNNNSSILFDEETRTQITAALLQQVTDKVYLDKYITINKLALLCNTNRTYLSQIINYMHKTNFNTFINKLRIEEAKKLLLMDNMKTPLKHLCTQSGFNSYTVFNDAFKRFVGVTPAFFQRTVTVEREEGK
jgi:AraC-like DNA-binding protein